MSAGWARGVIARAAARCGFDLDEVTGPSRRRALVRVRMAAVLVICDERATRRAMIGGPVNALSLPQIGQMLGGRDHSTVCHLLERGKDMLRRDAHFAALVEWLRADAAERAAPVAQQLVDVAGAPEVVLLPMVEPVRMEAKRFLATRAPRRDVRGLDDEALLGLAIGSIALRRALLAAAA